MLCPPVPVDAQQVAVVPDSTFVVERICDDACSRRGARGEKYGDDDSLHALLYPPGSTACTRRATAKPMSRERNYGFAVRIVIASWRRPFSSALDRKSVV